MALLLMVMMKSLALRIKNCRYNNNNGRCDEERVMMNTNKVDNKRDIKKLGIKRTSGNDANYVSDDTKYTK